MTDAVLIVDDEEPVRRTFEEWLRGANLGVRVYAAADAEAALAAVSRQLDRIRPAKRQREVNRTLAAFREAVEKVLPIVRTAAALNDPVPLPTAVKSPLK